MSEVSLGTMSTPPRPISDALRAELDRVMPRLDALPEPRKGYAQIDLSVAGAEAEVGWRLSRIWSVGAWGATTWRGLASGGARLRAAW